MTSKAQIVPHHDRRLAKGVDICGTAENVYIIRSDLGCYMKCNTYLDDPPPAAGGLQGQKYEIHPLHPSCIGDHYMIGPDDIFYIIKGDHFICVNHLSHPTAIPIQIQPLSTACQNGDNYLYLDKYFYIITNGTGKYTLVSDLTGESEGEGTILEAYLKHGAYFFGARKTINIISQVPDWGVTFTLTPGLHSSTSARAYFVYPDLVNFLPGGLSIDFGVTVPKWELLQSFSNSSTKAPLQWSKKIKVTMGYNKSHFQSIENNWDMSTSVSVMGTKFESGFLVQASLEAQFALTSSYGGANVRSDQEDWNEVYETEEQLSTEIPPGAKVYIWQFRLGLKGTNTVLFCPDLKMTDDETPPPEIPLRLSSHSLSI